ncbi:hypothetical protein GJ496_007759 [Pomphorhynchus laevis]|nr:hypothetical protein GJ496_007759 [Pomphorhynchus laevis]
MKKMVGTACFLSQLYRIHFIVFAKKLDDRVVIGSSQNCELMLQKSLQNLNCTSYRKGMRTKRLEDGILDEFSKPHLHTYRKIESIVIKMMDNEIGVEIKTVSGCLSSIPSVFTGSDLIQWIIRHLNVDDTAEAMHLAHSISSRGYIFPIDDRMLTVKNDGTFYRFQTPFLWPSFHDDPDSVEYAVYLCKRAMQNKSRMELADYEAENLAKLQKQISLSRKWELIYLEAEVQMKIDKKRDKTEKLVLDSQEQAFWDFYRPAPNHQQHYEQDIRKSMRTLLKRQHFSTMLHTSNCHNHDIYVDMIQKEYLTKKCTLTYAKSSKIAEIFISKYAVIKCYDPFLVHDDSGVNVWLKDSTYAWDNESTTNYKRIKMWSVSIFELLRDPLGRKYFNKYLDKEFSGENLMFILACFQLRKAPTSEVSSIVNSIYCEFFAASAKNLINVDSKIMNKTVESIQNPTRYCFDEALEHILNLMARDSYTRFLRSGIYKKYLGEAREKRPSSRTHGLSIMHISDK